MDLNNSYSQRKWVKIILSPSEMYQSDPILLRLKEIKITWDKRKRWPCWMKKIGTSRSISSGSKHELILMLSSSSSWRATPVTVCNTIQFQLIKSKQKWSSYLHLRMSTRTMKSILISMRRSSAGLVPCLVAAGYSRSDRKCLEKSIRLSRLKVGHLSKACKCRKWQIKNELSELLAKMHSPVNLLKVFISNSRKNSISSQRSASQMSTEWQFSKLNKLESMKL